MNDEEERGNRSSVVGDLLANELVGESVGCLIEAGLTGCAPLVLIVIGLPVALFWWK